MRLPGVPFFKLAAKKYIYMVYGERCALIGITMRVAKYQNDDKIR